MYGMMPSAKTESCSSAPPENRFSSVKTPRGRRRADGVDALLHVGVRDARAGQRGAEPVDRDDRHREQHLLAQVRRPERTEKGGEQLLPPARGGRRLVGRGGGSGCGAGRVTDSPWLGTDSNSLDRRSGRCATATSRIGWYRRCTRRRPTVAPAQCRRRRAPLASAVAALQLGGGATGGRDLLLGRRAERVRRDLELHAAELAGAEHLDRLALADRAGLDQLERADLRRRSGTARRAGPG